MAIIKGKAPEPVETRASPQLVIKFAARDAKKLPDEAARLIRSLGGERSFHSLSEGEEGLAEGSRGVLDRYVSLAVPSVDQADDVARKLTELPEIEIAYVSGGPTPPPVSPADDPRNANQDYLDAAPRGIDARWSWGLVDGSGIGFVDLEQGWTLNHEDLNAAGITIISGVSQAYHGHGTAVLGEVVGVDNNVGGVGIAPSAATRVVSQYRTATSYNTAAAIVSAADNMAAGDVLLLEAQTTVGSSTYLPVEAEPAVFDAIKSATDQGIIVVEAAGNGSNDLDNFTNSAGKQVLNRISGDFMDSGAIMVAAASSTDPHQPLSFTNFGSRIDCYAWGENIDTSGDGWTGTGTTTYTGFFGGTSGASPIITGAALLLQAWAQQADGARLSPAEVRGILGDPLLNTPSASPGTDRIGVMPNLRAIIEFQQRARRLKGVSDRYASLVYILVGIIDDSPGIIWVPGKGPVPVDPEWGRRIERVSGAKRDLLASLAISELASRISDAETRQAVVASSVEAMKRSIERMGLEGPG